MRFEELASRAGKTIATVGSRAQRPAFGQVLADHRRRTIISIWSTAAVFGLAIFGFTTIWPGLGAGIPSVAAPTTTTTTSVTTTLTEDTMPAALAGVPESCPVTLPGDNAFTPASEAPDGLSPGDDAVWYGTPELWTKLPPNEQVRNRSWLYPGAKTFWWSENFPGGAIEGSPNITVTGEHLDGSAPTVEAGGPGTNGFHPDMGDFMLVGVELPEAGCWELTAEYNGASLSYVIWVSDD